MFLKTFFSVCLTISLPPSALAAGVTGKISGPGDRPLTDAVVFVSALPPGVTLPKRAQPPLVIRAGRLEPPVFVLQTQTPLVITNADDALYNLHLRFRKNTERNVGMTPHRQATVHANQPELFARVTDDLFSLNGYICLLEHPFYAVTDVAGRFTLPDLPEGTYTIQAAHSRLAPVQREVKVTGATVTADFTLPLRSAKSIL